MEIIFIFLRKFHLLYKNSILFSLRMISLLICIIFGGKICYHVN